MLVILPSFFNSKPITMKKVILSFTLFILLSISLQAQEKSGYKNLHSIGMNINSIVNSFDFGVFYSPSTPYTLIYRYNMKNWAIKAGFGGNFSNSERDNDNGQANGSYKNHMLDFRLGFDRIFMSKQRFSATVGVDVIYNSSRNYNEYQVNTSNQSTYDNRGSKFGFGPTTTLDFKITDWISLSTEMTFYLTRNSEKYARNDNSTNFQDQVDTSKAWSSILNKPTALYLNIRF